MGWISDLWDDFTAWVRNLLTSALRWIIGKIEDFTVWLKVTRHKFNIWLANFLATDTGFWIALSLVAVLIVGTAISIKTGYLQTALLKVKAFLAQLKSVTGSVLARLHFSELYSLNQIAIILLPFYEELWDAMYKAMGALAEELGLGVGTITAFLRNANALIVSTYTAVGYSMNEAEVIYMQSSNEFFSKVDGRFERYARNPEFIFKDINEEIVKPALLVQSETQYQQALMLERTVNKLVETDNNVQAVENSLKQMVADLPDEINEVVSQRTDVFFETIDDFREDYIVPTLDKLVAIDNVVQDYIEVQEIQRLNWSHLLNNPGNFLMQIELLPPEERNKQRALIRQMINALGIGDIEGSVKGLIDGTIRIDDELYDVNKPAKLPIQEYITPPRLIISTEKIESKIQSWFVGEY